nr:hypothetical protein BaRGS_007758 [Batillaria attramentaria]
MSWEELSVFDKALLLSDGQRALAATIQTPLKYIFIAMATPLTLCNVIVFSQKDMRSASGTYVIGLNAGQLLYIFFNTLVLNVLTIWALQRHNMAARQVQSTTNEDAKRQQERQLTFTLLCASAAYVLLSLPAAFLNLISTTVPEFTPTGKYRNVYAVLLRGVIRLVLGVFRLLRGVYRLLRGVFRLLRGVFRLLRGVFRLLRAADGVFAVAKGPCHYGFDYVGKMETFMLDAEFILSKAGVDMSVLSSDDRSFSDDNDLILLEDLAKDRFLHAVKRVPKCPQGDKPIRPP